MGLPGKSQQALTNTVLLRLLCHSPSTPEPGLWLERRLLVPLWTWATALTVTGSVVRLRSAPPPRFCLRFGGLKSGDGLTMDLMVAVANHQCACQLLDAEQEWHLIVRAERQRHTVGAGPPGPPGPPGSRRCDIQSAEYYYAKIIYLANNILYTFCVHATQSPPFTLRI